MGTVYIDVLITVNIFIDFFLIICVKALLHINQKLYRLIFGAVLGGFFSLAALLPRIPFGLNFIADAALAVPIILVSFGFGSIKLLIKRTALYFFCSFFFCGIMIFVYTSFRPKGMEIYNDVVYFNISPVLLIILTLVCYYLLRLWERFSKSDMSRRVCKVTIRSNGKSADFNAVVDTGCNVREPFSDDYVIIAERELLNGIEPEENTLRLIPFETIAGSGIIRGFKPKQVLIDGREATESLYIGCCENVLKGDVRAIIPSELTKYN
ncbi:MAG TPA: hypothetical protein DEO32_03230 [Ruminococcaceae bacterium]|nr:hypothetical protein [Oscillospiraceae bacterium]